MGGKRNMKTKIYKKPEILAENTIQMGVCGVGRRPSGKPCNPPQPNGHYF